MATPHPLRDRSSTNAGATDAGGEAATAMAHRILNLVYAAPSSQLSDVVSWHAHVPFAYALVAIDRPRRVVELGVHKGDSFLTFCRALGDHGIDAEAIGVDTWQGDAHAGAYQGDMVLADVERRLAPFAGGRTRLLRKTFDDALDDIADGSVDLLHIDGLHTFEAVRHDFLSWKPKLSARGIVLFHDTEVRRDDFGVWRLWEEVQGSAPSYNFPYGNGLGVLLLGSDVSEETQMFLRVLREDLTFADLSPRDAMASLGIGLEAQGMTVFLQGEVERHRNEIQSERETAAREFGRLNGLVEELNGRIARIVGEQQQLTAARDALAKENNQLSEERAIFVHERDAISEERDSLSWERHSLSKQRDALWAERNALSEERDHLVADRDRLSLDCEKLQEDAVELNHDLAAVRAELVHVKQWHTSLKRVAKGHGIRTTAAKSKRLLVGRARSLAGRGKIGALFGIKAAGRSLLSVLPVNDVVKQRVKGRLITTVGPWIGWQTNMPPPPDMIPVGDLNLTIPGERYLELSRCARGAPSNVPPRSVSIVIPVFNQLEYTLRCLASIAQNTAGLDYEVIVVDDGSNDGTAEAIAVMPGVRYVRNPKNLGFIGSCNAGAAAALKTYVCFLNNDTEALPGWLSALVDSFELHEHAGLVGSKLVYPDGRLQEAGGLIWEDGSGWNWGRFQDPNDPRYNYARRTDYCSGAAILLPRALFAALGGFDAHYTPAYGEDSDLAFKIRALGLATLYQPNSQVLHFEGVSNGRDTAEGVKHYQLANAEKLRQRWAPVLTGQGRAEAADLLADRGVVGRILVIDQITPTPDRDAGSLTALEIMRALRDLGYKITFVPCSNFCYIPEYTDLLAALGIESVCMPWAGSFKQHLERYGSHYDAAVVFRPSTWLEFMPLIRQFAPNAKLIYHASDLHFLREERKLSLSNAGPAPVSKQLAADKANEVALLGEADLCIVHSTAEADLIRDLHPDGKVVCFPWIYEPRGAGEAFAERTGLVYLGGYQHQPNVDAVEHYVHNIHPLVAASLPASATFMAAGSNPPKSMTDLAAPGVEVLGYVPDITPVLFSARVMVVPLRYGAGIKGKILTAMAHGMPVVTTTVGAEGMGLIDGEHVLIGDTSNDFANAVIRLYTDAALWHRLQAAGLAYVAETTSRAAGLGIVAGLLRQLELPHLPYADDFAQRLPPGVATAFGSHPAAFDLASLIDIGRSYLQEGAEGRLDCIAVDGAALGSGAISRLPPSVDVVALGAGALPPGAKVIIAVVDATCGDEAAAATCLALGESAADASLVIVFAGPKLFAGTDGYSVRHPFTDAAVGTVVLPLHETWAGHLAVLSRPVNWHYDSSLMGFASTAVAVINPGVTSAD